MSKTTERFNVTVQTAHKTYKPGEPVPVGTDAGISKEEVIRLRENFGDWIGPDVNSIASAGVDMDELQLQIDSVTTERDQLQGEKDRLTAENARLEGEITQRGRDTKATRDVERLKAENTRLAGELSALQDAKLQLETDNGTLAGHISKLEADIATLTAPKT
ncbi:hypothetical protein P6U16_08410 [Rhizobium sp. 32-5/1]|uniref:hypothetical protein n=1 Tax=Rhizobium sp. 32-5/1 TaxID=3019602 RepID=UPI00240D84A9|nr:hypothetical protein [Rhizobium sp. 32-5/1]WEZ84582.1 hypothetical protein P6U16_08410 [Rhizobium sp. 32-5/1]